MAVARAALAPICLLAFSSAIGGLSAPLELALPANSGRLGLACLPARLIGLLRITSASRCLWLFHGHLHLYILLLRLWGIHGKGHPDHSRTPLPI